MVARRVADAKLVRNNETYAEGFNPDKAGTAAEIFRREPAGLYRSKGAQPVHR